MPLYNNILLSRKAEGKTNELSNVSVSPSSTSMKFLQDHLLSKKRYKQQCPTQSQAIAQQHKQTDKSKIVLENVLHKPLSGNDWDLQDEYDPMVPNSYDLLLAEHIRAEEQKLATRKSEKLSHHLLDVLDKLDEFDCTSTSKTTRGTSIAPPASMQLSKDSDTQSKPALGYTQISEKSNGVAAKIMSKMGYKVGQGLGRDEQGMATPLEVEKSGSNAGRIIQCSTMAKSEDSNQYATRVILLQNMVGPGEVDDDLEGETKEECTKYGEVVKCLIYEIPNKKVPDEEAVRIFVEFRKNESAIKAVSDLNGRYFGGRVVKATFYNVERFNKYELGP